MRSPLTPLLVGRAVLVSCTGSTSEPESCPVSGLARRLDTAVPVVGGDKRVTPDGHPYWLSWARLEQDSSRGHPTHYVRGDDHALPVLTQPSNGQVHPMQAGEVVPVIGVIHVLQRRTGARLPFAAIHLLPGPAVRATKAPRVLSIVIMIRGIRVAWAPIWVPWNIGS